MWDRSPGYRRLRLEFVGRAGMTDGVAVYRLPVRLSERYRCPTLLDALRQS